MLESVISKFYFLIYIHDTPKKCPFPVAVFLTLNDFIDKSIFSSTSQRQISTALGPYNSVLTNDYVDPRYHHFGYINEQITVFEDNCH